MTKFKLGDVIRKKTGGPKMTINEIYPTGPDSARVWFDASGKLHEESISNRALKVERIDKVNK